MDDGRDAEARLLEEEPLHVVGQRGDLASREVRATGDPRDLTDPMGQELTGLRAVQRPDPDDLE